MRYRRARIPGATYFFTVNIAERKRDLLIRHIDVLRQAVRQTRQAYPFDIVAMVVLPDHLHAIWTLPAGDADYPLRWSLIKAAFSRRLPKEESVGDSPQRASEWPFSTIHRYIRLGLLTSDWADGENGPGRFGE